jgi:CDGSH-type Zn-finger protein
VTGSQDTSDRSLTVKITVTPQGPYVVSGGTPVHRTRAVRTEQDEPLAWEHDPPLDADESYELCRCGGSGTKPFCDGTHETREWDGTETAPTDTYAERAKTLPGSGITVRDDRGICEHAGFCGNKISNVWKLTQDSDSTPVRSQIAAMVERCPSGALTYRLDRSTADQEPHLAAGISVVEDGPLWLTGGVPVSRSDGAPMETRNRMTLCRCGASKNKPLCDGSHASVDFHDA